MKADLTALCVGVLFGVLAAGGAYFHASLTTYTEQVITFFTEPIWPR